MAGPARRLPDGLRHGVDDGYAQPVIDRGSHDTIKSQPNPASAIESTSLPGRWSQPGRGFARVTWALNGRNSVSTSSPGGELRSKR